MIEKILSNNESIDLEIKFNDQLYKVIPKEIIANRLEPIVKSFGNDYPCHFPTTVISVGEIYRLFHLSSCMNQLKDCDGFSDHIMQYKTNVQSAEFVTILADYLASRSSKLILEPMSLGTNKKADVLATIKGTDIYFECKDPKNEILKPIVKEHLDMYSALHPYINRPCDVSVSYTKSMTPSELNILGGFLADKLPLITGEGRILNQNGIKVGVTNIRESFVNQGDIVVCRMWENYHENSARPGTIINRNGKSMAFFKDGVSAYKNIENQLRKSKNKVHKNSPIVVAIHSENIPGNLSSNVEFISSLFNENNYTSFNGVLLMKHWYSETGIPQFKSNYINNPFARNQIPNLAGIFL